MKYIKTASVLFLIFSVFIVNCTSPTSSEKAIITGRVFCADSGNPTSGAKVILRKNFGHGMPNVFSFYDSTYTNYHGYFTFNNIEKGFYELYACKYSNSGEQNLTYISQLSNSINLTDEVTTYTVEDVFLIPILNEGKIKGNLVINTTQLPADSALVNLWRLEECTFTKIDSVLSNSNGNFLFENVRTGTHLIYASAIDTSWGFSAHVYNSQTCFCNGQDIYTVDTLFLTCIQDEKPAIYIYPEEDSQFQVNLILRNGTKITKSIPEYKSGWDVFVENSGRIDSKYDYLFYEASIKMIPEISYGWCISQKDIKIELNNLLLKIGLNTNETNEFLDYWLNRLKDYNYYIQQKIRPSRFLKP
ncbi:MAG: hypothetical protein H8D22_03780 [Candidatus Cloacimonetes bacterium]|nr:hypothetical protein [Candidatus Cloacimonadota bacterium]